MANEVLFTVDASEIMAKLHLAGRQATALNTIDGFDEFVVNTGVKNDNKNAKPDSPNNVSFDITAGEYQVGFVTLVSYRYPFGLQAKASEYDKLFKDASKEGIDAKTDSPKQEKLKEARESLAKLLGKDPEDDSFKSEEGIAKLQEEVKKTIADDEAAYNSTLAEAEQNAIEQLGNYMKTFAGQAFKGVDASKVGLITVSDKVKFADSKDLVKGFQLQPIPSSERDALNAEFKQAYIDDPKEKNCHSKVCFFVKYTLDVDK